MAPEASWHSGGAAASVYISLSTKYRCCNAQIHKHGASRAGSTAKSTCRPREDKHTHTHTRGRAHTAKTNLDHSVAKGVSSPLSGELPRLARRLSLSCSRSLPGKIHLTVKKWRGGGGTRFVVRKAGQSDITQCLTLHFQSQPSPLPTSVNCRCYQRSFMKWLLNWSIWTRNHNGRLDDLRKGPIK